MPQFLATTLACLTIEVLKLWAVNLLLLCELTHLLGQVSDVFTKVHWENMALGDCHMTVTSQYYSAR